MIGTETVVDAARVQQYRERLHNALNRNDEQVQLLARGVDLAQIQTRAWAA